VSTYRFTVEETFGVWQAHGAICFWCGEPLEFRQTTVDHWVPETITVLELKALVRTYKLPVTWTVNGFENWVPIDVAPVIRAG